MMFGFEIPPEVLASYEAFQNGKTYDFIILRMADDHKTVVVEKCVDKGESEKVESFSAQVEDVAGPGGKVYKNFVTHLTEGRQCGFGIFDVTHEVKETGTNTQKWIMVGWRPDSAPMRQRMQASSVTDGLLQSFKGVASVSVKDFSELKYGDIIQKVSIE